MSDQIAGIDVDRLEAAAVKALTKAAIEGSASAASELLRRVDAYKRARVAERVESELDESELPRVARKITLDDIEVHATREQVSFRKACLSLGITPKRGYRMRQARKDGRPDLAVVDLEIETLDGAMRRAISLMAWDGWATVDVADELNVGVETLRTWTVIPAFRDALEREVAGFLEESGQLLQIGGGIAVREAILVAKGGECTTVRMGAIKALLVHSQIQPQDRSEVFEPTRDAVVEMGLNLPADIIAEIYERQQRQRTA
jgi:hypothetical protein